MTSTQDNILDEILQKLINGAQYEYKPSTRQRRRTEAKKQLQSLLKQAELRGMKLELKKLMKGKKTITQFAGDNVKDIIAYTFSDDEIKEELASLEAEMENLS